MFNRVDYRFFVNMFNVDGVYSKKYLPGWRLEGFASVKQIDKWINQHLEEKSTAQKNPSTIFCLPKFFDKKKIVHHVENRFTTHLVVNWFDYREWSSFDKTNNHVVGISIIKDSYEHYHIFYLNKGARTINQSLHWFYIPPSQKKIVMDLISAAGSSDQKDLEEVIKQLILLKNTLSINIPQPSNHKRGTCAISNAVKNIVRVEAIMKHLDKNDFRKYLSPQIASEIAMDKKLYEDYIKEFKEKTYHVAWQGAFEFAELFEKTTDKQRNTSLGILFLQGMLNRFHKSHFSENENDKLKLELTEITDLFNHLLDNKYYQAATILLVQFAKCDVSRRKAKEIYLNCLQKMVSLPEKIVMDDTLLDIILLDILADINAKKFTSAYAQYELLNNILKIQENSLCQLVFSAITQNNLNLLQSKLSSPVNAQAFQAFTFLLSLEKDYADLSSLPTVPQISEAPLFLHAAAEMGKLKTVKHLVEDYKINTKELDSQGLSALDIVAQCGHLKIYEYLANCSLPFIDSSLMHAVFYQKYEIVKFAFENYPDKVSKDASLYALTCNDIFNNINLNKLLEINQSDNDFYFSIILFSAVATDHFDKIKFHLDKKDISVDHQGINKGNTLLHYIAFFAKTDMFYSLLQYHPDLFIKNKLGKSPFQIAVDRANKVDTFKIIDFYLENHFSSIPEEELNACLIQMLKCGKIETVETMLRQHAFTHKIIQDAFWHAVNNGFILIANQLMKYGASINEPDEEGATIMHLAASKGGRILFWAYENQGNIYAKTPDGILPIQYAKFESIKYLLMQVVDKLYNERSNIKPGWSYYFDPIIDLLKQLVDLIKESNSLQDFVDKCHQWSITRSKDVTKIEILYTVDSIKLSLQPLLEPLFSLLSKEEKAEQSTCLKSLAVTHK